MARLCCQLSMFFFLVPVFGLGLAMVTYGEAISRPAMAGVALIFAGIGVALAQSWRGANACHGRAQRAAAKPNGAP